MGYSVRVVHNKGGRRNKKGLYPIYILVIINRKPYYFNLGKKIEKIHWQGKDNVWVKPSYRYSSQLNIIIKRKLDDMMNHILRVESYGHHITIEHFKSIFSKTSTETFNEFVADFMKHQLKGLSLNTIKKYRTFERYLNQYNSAIAFSVINERFIIDFSHWLHKEQPASGEFKGKKKLHGSTIHKYIDPFRVVVRQAYKEGYYEKDPFYGVKIPYTEKRKDAKVYLSISEIKKLKEKIVPPSRFVLEKIREWFLFSFYCGIRYKDLTRLTWDHFIETDQGICLAAKRVKNDNDYHVPLYLSPHAIEILNKRREANTENVFPDVISEQKYNEHLKELAELVGITKNLKNSSARDAFGKFWARKGIPIQHLAKMMGHADEKTTKKYYDIDGEDINEHLGNMKSIGLFKIDF